MDQKKTGDSHMPTAAQLADWLGRLCPGKEGEFVRALHWLYQNPDLAAYLCGEKGASPQEGAGLLRQLRQAGQPEYMAPAAYRLWRESENRKGKNGR